MTLRPVLTWDADLGYDPPAQHVTSDGRFRVEDLDTGRFGWARLVVVEWDDGEACAHANQRVDEFDFHFYCVDCGEHLGR